VTFVAVAVVFERDAAHREIGGVTFGGTLLLTTIV